MSLMGLDLSEDFPNFTNHDISESNMRCDICIRKCGMICPKIELVKELLFL